MERNITIRKTTEICNCNGCGARNYNSSFVVYNEHTPKVDALYELHIGSQCSILCADCVDELSMHIACVRGSDMLKR